MARPLCSKTIKNFLEQGKFDLEPVYVATPDGYVLELTRMAFITVDEDEEHESDTIYPVFIGQYTDIAADIESSIGEPGSDLPPS